VDKLGKSRGLITFVKDRPGHDRRYAIDAGKIMDELGWAPSVDFPTGLGLTIDWYLANRDWWETIRSGEYRQYYDRCTVMGGGTVPKKGGRFDLP
jgi:dTDP-glucose 4,6-dehydratase